MPNRILRESICTSEDVDNLSTEAEVLFYRLIVQADDFGRADGRPSIIRARCFPLRLDRVQVDDVAAWLAELVDEGMVLLYEVEGKPYLQLTGWNKHQHRRAQTSKFPPPPADASSREHVRADSPEESRSRESRNRGVEEREARKDMPAPAGATEQNGKGKDGAPFFLADVVNLGLVTSLIDRYRRRNWDKAITPGLLTGLVLGSEDHDLPACGARAVNAAIDDLYANAATTKNPAAYLKQRAVAHAEVTP